MHTGDELLQRNKNDSYAQALVAFCVYTGLYARQWNWPTDPVAGDLWSRQSLASLFQSESLKVQDPAIQLMAAVSKANLPTSREFDEALDLFGLVLHKEPRWADALCWYQRGLYRATAQKGKIQLRKAAIQCLALCNRAERLDQGLHNFLLLERFPYLDELNRSREALAAFEGYLRVYPAFAQDLEERFPGYVAKTRVRLTQAIQRQSAHA